MKNFRKLLAFLGALLMLASVFLLPLSAESTSNGKKAPYTWEISEDKTELSNEDGTYYLYELPVGYTVSFTTEYNYANTAKGFNYLNMNIGEEDLFIQKIAKPKNVSVVLIPKGAMVERLWGGMRWWISQLRHYGSAYRFYPQSVRNAVSWDLGSQVLLFLTVLTALIFMPLEFKLAAFLLLLVRYLVAMLRVRSVAKRVGEKGMVLRYFLFDLFNPLLMMCVRLSLMRKDDTACR